MVIVGITCYVMYYPFMLMTMFAPACLTPACVDSLWQI